ncbi:complex I NDUFA9 subunit family protein [Paracoccus sp. P2]|uniref:Complex I NDUFA9 subunit family protein n=1 Tax=Paracoccus pantotrophus TaxID=82367 RepID=A0A1I5E7Y5_PARPN|nr:complex I NDUFA9 subunit family protein [Paracoccus pantotrophus]MDF3853192.1 complex I NDUFA9 subunit family protein [Paracoccus pantotrophus]QFG36905.1 complex I NDUFA9 subunit family protein [Paracoccus pantotrophus]QLH14469.1 complex I NDUFA9 subunit family protein [Paracoccus pantotrophus]RDD96322.1 complex I NDUFA9 subunit family protein [Paracoccus pantotrophus]RKS52687.1 NADH dehydrogenase [Paracoccus pantotrophus]
MSAAKLVTIYGGSGFLGRQIARVMAAQGWRIRVAVRRPNEAGVVRTYGAPGQVEPVPCNVRDDLSVTACMADADAVINCVGIMVREGRNTFDAIHEEAAGRVARIAAETGVRHFVHVSAIGADPDSDSRYAATKGRGEAAVLAHRPDAVILRPSVMFGPDDHFYNRIASMTRLGPILLVPGANTQMQPVYVEDVARAAAMAAAGQAEPGIYELGGPDVLTMREVAQQVLVATDRRRAIIGLPNWLGRVMGSVLDTVQTVSGGLLTNRIMTRDQARLLRRPNRVSGQVKTFADLGIEPTAAPAIIAQYLWRFRPSGQYEAITASAKNLRNG